MPEELYGHYYMHTGKSDYLVSIQREGMVLGQGQEALCYLRGPGRGSHALGAPGVMYSQRVIVRWDDPLKQ